MDGIVLLKDDHKTVSGLAARSNAAVAVVGKEDGAHHARAEVFQALNDVGSTIPAIGPYPPS